MSAGSRQLLAFRFGSESKFEGQLVGALERIETGGTMRVVDGLFVSREPQSDELTAIVLSDGPSSRIISRLLDFRLDDRKRRVATQQALDGATGDAVQSLAALLTPGTAVAAVLVEHRWVDALTDAVARVGGTEVVSEFVDAGTMNDVAQRLVAAAQQTG
jgi:hypothetical protein